MARTSTQTRQPARTRLYARRTGTGALVVVRLTQRARPITVTVTWPHSALTAAAVVFTEPHLSTRERGVVLAAVRGLLATHARLDAPHWPERAALWAEAERRLDRG